MELSFLQGLVSQGGLISDTLGPLLSSLAIVKSKSSQQQNHKTGQTIKAGYLVPGPKNGPVFNPHILSESPRRPYVLSGAKQNASLGEMRD